MEPTMFQRDDFESTRRQFLVRAAGVVAASAGAMLWPTNVAYADDTLKWVKKVKKGLAKLGTYASADAFMNCPMKDGKPVDWEEGFAGCVNPERRDAVLERYVKYGKKYKQSLADALLLPKRPWQADRYEKLLKKVKKAKAGICTTLAMAGAHVLTDGRDSGPRVEIVAFDNHVYILVGRVGDSAKKKKWKISDDWHKQKDIVIVDPWAGAMGYAIIYKGLKKYPYEMIEGLTLVAERPAS